MYYVAVCVDYYLYKRTGEIFFRPFFCSELFL